MLHSAELLAKLSPRTVADGNFAATRFSATVLGGNIGSRDQPKFRHALETARAKGARERRNVEAEGMNGQLAVGSALVSGEGSAIGSGSLPLSAAFGQVDRLDVRGG